MPIDCKTLPALLVALPLAALLTACNQGEVASAPPPAKFGDANRITMMAQVIDPDPQYAEPMATSAEHAAQAIERVRTDKVKQPERVRSTQRISGGGGGSGGN